MLKPNKMLHRVTDITPETLSKLGAKALALDIDNTLSTHHGKQLLEGLTEWLEMMKEIDVQLLLFSNSKEFRVQPFAKRLGLDYISLGLKPLPFGFFRAAKKLKVKRKELVLAGDQIFTDVLGARLAGAKVVLLDPIKPEDKLSFRVRRAAEKGLREKYKRRCL